MRAEALGMDLPTEINARLVMIKQAFEAFVKGQSVSVLFQYTLWEFDRPKDSDGYVGEFITCARVTSMCLQDYETVIVSASGAVTMGSVRGGDASDECPVFCVVVTADFKNRYSDQEVRLSAPLYKGASHGCIETAPEVQLKTWLVVHNNT